MDSSAAQEVQNLDPDLSDSNIEESEEKILNATSLSAFDMILKSMRKISVFLSHFLMDYIQEVPESLTDDESVLPQDLLCDFLLEKISLTHPLEANGVFDLFLNILELMSRWDSDFEVYEVAKKICNRCKMGMELPPERCFGLIINAGTLREVKAMFEKFTFEKIIQVIRIDLKMPCDKEGWEKRNYVQRMIYKPPTVFTIALEWENNETEGEIFDTTSVLKTEIDINTIYQYKGDIAVTKYRLASMVCSHGDQYNCVAYEKKGWVRHVGSEEEVIGDWNGVLSIFWNLHIRPEILFFENAMQRDQLVSKVSED